MTRNYRVRPIVSLSAAVLAAAAVFCVSSPVPALAQTTAPPWEDSESTPDLRDWSDEVPAHVSIADGDAWLDREGTVETDPQGVPLLAGDWLRTRLGRLEVVFADGSVLSVDEQTDAELLSDGLLRLDRGRIRVDLARAGGAAGYRIDAAGTTTWLRSAGEYRIEMTDRGAAPDVRLLVARGLAELSANGGNTLVSSGHEAFGSADTRPSLPYAVTVSRWDDFDRWWNGRRDTRAGVASTRYLPTEIAYYGGVLDRDGDWQYEPDYGYVWYPRVVAGWQPYSAGRWSYVGTYGWVWVGADRWAWPTHHYGRWGYSGQRYYWIPGRQWAPAWVSWASSPGYVGWVPLGFNNRPLISVQVGYSSGGRGWTYAPARSFGATVVVANRGRYLPPRNSQFSNRDRGPGRPASIGARNAPSGLRGPAGVSRGAVAVPRVPPGRTRAPNVDAAVSPGRLPSPRTAASPPARTSAASARRQPATVASTPPPVNRSPGISRPAVAPRAPQSRPSMPSSQEGPTGIARSRAGTIARQPPPSTGPDREPQRATEPARTPALRSRTPAPVPGPAPPPARGPRNQSEGRGPGSSPASRAEPGRPAPTAPSRPPAAGMRAPQTPRVEASRPAARQAPRQTPSESPRARAVPRDRD